MIKKNDEIIVDIVDNGFQGEGIAKSDGITIFIPNVIKGEKAKIKILKVASNIAYGKLVELINKSEYRAEADCETYSKCGGCNLRHVKYSHTLEIKKESVLNTLRKALGREVVIDEIIGMEEPFYYRNKLQYPVGKDENGSPVMGVFAERSHRIIPTHECMIQDKKSQEIANSLFDFIKENQIPVYDELSQTGTIRHIIIRKGKKTNEIMVTLVSNTELIVSKEIEKRIVDFIISKYPEIRTIVKNVNNKNTNVILGYDKENVILYGEGYIEDYLGDFRFKISPMSFYQVNPVQTEKLYSKAVEYAGLTGKEIIFDLYCGIGTIGIFASPNAKKIYGIETISEAIEDAKVNAKLNNIENAEYYVGDVEKFLPQLIESHDIIPNVVFVDPPRKGCDKIAIDTLLKIEPNKIVYVSCNPATLTRDVRLLEEKYSLEKVSIVDMFPYTSHCESVCVLERR